MGKMIEFKRPDGQGVMGYLAEPADAAGAPGVVVIQEWWGLNTQIKGVADRYAEAGYAALVPDLFRGKSTVEAAEAEHLMTNLNFGDAASQDIAGAVQALKARQIGSGKVGITGYCMGGGVVLRAAGTYPDKVASAGAFHGGNMATDAEDSPHLLAPRIKARIYVGGADQDNGFLPDQAERLAKALTAAGVSNRVEIYEGARHGYAPKDMPAYNAAGAERHWRELFKLFSETL